MKAEADRIKAEVARADAEKAKAEREKAIANADKAIAQQKAIETNQKEIAIKSQVDKEAKEKLLTSAKKFGDLGSLAINTPRIALGPIIRDMQNLKRDVETIQTGECTSTAKKYLMENIDITVDNFTSFFGDADYQIDSKAITDSMVKYSQAIDLCK